MRRRKRRKKRKAKEKQNKSRRKMMERRKLKKLKKLSNSLRCCQIQQRITNKKTMKNGHIFSPSMKASLTMRRKCDDIFEDGNLKKLKETLI